ncbi:MAG: porin family protein [Campylobacteraceae bacterium]|jgi:hypothetical protein|nr:porin family protein [Campylobacteraceae bacterium]
MRFMVKVLGVAIVAGLFCNTLMAAEDGFVARVGFGWLSLQRELSGSGKNSDSGAALDIYGGYRMQNAQFGLSYTTARCDGCNTNYILASGAYVFENFNTVKPFIGLGVGLLNYKESKVGFNERGVFGTVNLGVNIEFEHVYYAIEFRQRVFGGIDEDKSFGGRDFKAEPKQTYLLSAGYKF